MLRYYRRWLHTAFCHSVGVVDLCSGLVGSALGVWDHYQPGAGIMTAYGWQVPILALAAVMAVRLLLAPYWMWREGQPRPIYTLKLSFDDTSCVVTTAPGHGFPADSRFVRLVVENESEQTAQSVVAKLMDLKKIESGRELDTPYVDQLPLVWANAGPERISITKDERPHIDVAKATADVLVPQTVPGDKVRIVEAGTYRFTVQLFGSNVRSRSVAIDVVWPGFWADMEAKLAHGTG